MMQALAFVVFGVTILLLALALSGDWQPLAALLCFVAFVFGLCAAINAVVDLVRARRLRRSFGEFKSEHPHLFD